MDTDPRTAHEAKWGIAPGYHDIAGEWKQLEPGTGAALLAAMGAELGSGPPAAGAIVLRRGSRRRLPEASEVETEGGGRIELHSDRLPPELPHGYHVLRLRSGDELPLIVCPARCHPPPRRREFGLAVQLYGARSRSSWGIGDLGDLAELGGWAAGRLRARMLLLNPLHAPLPVIPQDPSPYFPSSRLFRNPLYIQVEAVPGAAAEPSIERLSATARRLNSERLIDHSAVYELKLRALRGIFRRADPGAPLDDYIRGQGTALEDYATFCVLSERHGKPWQRWPAGLRHPRSAAVARFARANRRGVRFHQWVQYLLDLQLAAAGRAIGLVNDLAIGVHPDGADAWLFQDTLAQSISVGAPPDPFNSAGQDWGLPPFDPWKLRAAGYAPYIQTLRSAFRHGEGVRIDHVMGLFRLFWIPVGRGPGAGGYVHYPQREMLDILALESQRNSAYVVGEDLGTVEDSVRRELMRRQVLSYRLLWFEDRPPREYPSLALAALTTHDLPTVAGIWDGTDGDGAIRGRVQRVTGLDDSATNDEAVVACYRALSEAPSRLLTATLEDLLAVTDRPNLPGTTRRTNWSLALPVSLERLMEDPRPGRVAAVLRGSP